jgi:hypothetical protein
MNSRTALYVQAIRGPVLLVTAGVLFAVHQAGMLSFSRTWPLLIIVIGIMKLLERAWAPVPAGAWPAAHAGSSPHPNQSRPGAGGDHVDQPSGQPPQGPGAVQS